MTTVEPQRDGRPVLDGFIERRTEGVAGAPAMLLRVWCRWCCRWHTHGLADSKPGDFTDRSAHCGAVKGSPYDETGYLIRVTSTPFSRIRKTMRQATTAQRSAMYGGRISPAVQRLRDQPLPTGQVPE